MDRTSGPSLTFAQQVGLWAIAAIVGLGLGVILHAGTLASIALVALVGIVIGVCVAARQRPRP